MKNKKELIKIMPNKSVKKSKKIVINNKAKDISFTNVELARDTESKNQTAEDPFFKHKIVLLIAVAALLFFNQMQLGAVTTMLGVSVPMQASTGITSGLLSYSGGDYDVSDVDVTELKSTAQSVAALFPIDEIETTDDAIAIMIPIGTPEYGEEMGVSFDDPINALSKLANAQRALLAGLSPEEKERFINLASMPVGISCEYCCGVGPVGIDSNGNSACGCQHNPALLSVTMWLMQNTDYTDAEILREVMRWKTLFFPSNMVELALQIAGGDTSVLEDLPGMVGGC